jgi:hypothetical protein
VFSPAERYVAGIRNGEGFAVDSQGRLFVTQHGRDQLAENWPALYRPKDGADLPAEELLLLQESKDYGWPECYFDGRQKKLLLAPEYGGDGGKSEGLCAERTGPVAFFPAHWAPNDLLIVTNPRFPAIYHEGAFIAFHGSWNRAPAPQGGYNVVFQPMKDGKASGDLVVFADGFAGAVKEPGRAAHRPMGLAAGPDGALYIADDAHGRIWRVTYQGAVEPRLASAFSPAAAAGGNAPNATPPEGVHADAGRTTASLAVPPGLSRDQVTLGSASSMARWPMGPARAATDRTVAAAPSARTSLAGSGSGATAAKRQAGLRRAGLMLRSQPIDLLPLAYRFRSRERLKCGYQPKQIGAPALLQFF